MKILFLCRFPPYEGARDSGRQDTYHYLLSLSHRHEVSVIAFIPDEDQRAVKELEAICRHVISVTYSEHNLAARLWRAMWRLIMPKVYGRNISVSYHRSLKQLVSSEDYDVYIIDGPMAPYIGQLSGGVCLLDEVDIYSHVAYQEYLQESGPIRRRLAGWDWRRTSSKELDYARRANAILVRSQPDKKYLQEHLPNKDIVILPPWFEGLDELRQIEHRRPEGNNSLFVGALTIPANQEAAIYYAREVFPLVRAEIPDAQFTIVGSKPTSRVMALERLPGVNVVGEVDALGPYYRQAAVNVVPLMIGGGIIVKTLNGLASGRPTVATKVGISGTGAQDGNHLLVVQGDAHEFASSVIRVLKDDRLWDQLAKDGRAYIERTFDWSNIIQEFELYLGYITQKHYNSPR